MPLRRLLPRTGQDCFGRGARLGRTGRRPDQNSADGFAMTWKWPLVSLGMCGLHGRGIPVHRTARPRCVAGNRKRPPDCELGGLNHDLHQSPVLILESSPRSKLATAQRRAFPCVALVRPGACLRNVAGPLGCRAARPSSYRLSRARHPLAVPLSGRSAPARHKCPLANSSCMQPSATACIRGESAENSCMTSLRCASGISRGAAKAKGK